jgi:hypothetical protein
MNLGKLVFAQITQHLPLTTFRRCVARYGGGHKVKSFSCLDHYLCMAFAQLTYRESLRDIEACLRAQAGKLYHMGIKSRVSRSTLADANESRDWRIYADFAQSLIAIARRLYAEDSFGVDLKDTVYALDASTIDLCLSVFAWAPFRSTKAAIKLHTLLDLRGNIPSFLHVSDGKLHDVNVLDLLLPEPGAFYIMDRGYIDFERLYRLHEAKSFFVTRAKSNLKAQRRYSHPSRSKHGVDLRSDYRAHRLLLAPRLRHTLASCPIQRPRHRQAAGVSHQQFHLASVHHHRALSLPVASRIVFQMDQATSSYQSLLRHLRERRQNPNLDCRLGLRARRHRQEATQPIGELV